MRIVKEYWNKQAPAIVRVRVRRRVVRIPSKETGRETIVISTANLKDTKGKKRGTSARIPTGIICKSRVFA